MSPGRPTTRPRTAGKARAAILPHPEPLLPQDLTGLKQQSVVFYAMTDAQLTELLGLASAIEAPARQVLFHVGEFGDSLYVLLSGKVKVSLLSQDGKEAILGVLGPGEVFGEMSLLDGMPRSATVTTLERARLLKLGRQDFLHFLQRNPDVMLNLLVAFSQRLRSTNTLIANLSFLNLPARLARLLMELGQRHGRPGPAGVIIGLRLSQEELGNLAGTSRESVNKQLRAWAESGLLEYCQGIITLKNVEGLYLQSLSP